MLTVGRLLPSILIISLSAGAKLILSFCLLRHRPLIQVLNVLILAFLSCQKVRRSRKRTRDRRGKERKKRFSLQLLSVIDTGSEKDSGAESHTLVTHFSLISVKTEDRQTVRVRRVVSRLRKGRQRERKTVGPHTF